MTVAALLPALACANEMAEADGRVFWALLAVGGGAGLLALGLLTAGVLTLAGSRRPPRSPTP